MFAVLHKARKSLTALAATAGLIALAACQPIQTAGGGGPSIDPRAPVAVALLVPGGSGQATDALVARSVENAARLAISDLGDVRIDLRVYSTAGQPAQAAALAQRAVDEGARIILGPVFAQEANAAGLAVAARGVNVLSLSNNPDIAGGNVFVLGNTFESTANRLADYAARQGKRRIMIVHEQNTVGEIGRTTIERAVSRSGATVVGTGSYAFSQTDIVQAIPGIAAAARSAGADAVFFTADTAGALPLVTQLLMENGIPPATTQYIGLTRWDIPQATLGLPGVQGGWFALPDPVLNERFQARYAAAFGEPPHITAAPAYDGIAAIGALIKAGRSDALSRAALTQGAGFVGVGGIFRLRGDGTNERGLAVAQIRNNQVVVIDPAPKSFGGAGF
ncbi:penicillin-binding protein activator [Ruixingdingia sedimenti]|uniref:Penicillin-binding protein activator n=1 Tax=Ruixingdingia sedimenti TaxID=3073604 RepID=A0ABU1F9W4_9RHOB|nr:penicillin-binding protein activator [Xinfangfangia sp. LG-4]MDR5653682.1 penicillin-binding protein activator [Xinfangfangia sp. LG-4]